MLPITAIEFASAVRRLTPTAGWSTRVAVAVSGGPDSVALLWLLSNYAREGVRGEGRPSEVVGLTVDHLLRPSSTQEALNVSMLAASLGVQHHTLEVPWSTSPFPPFPSPHKTEFPARTARLILFHRLLRAEGIDSLWMGHHRGDQRENKLLWGYGMEGITKLAGGELEKIVPAGTGQRPDGKSVVRPLLGFEKERLIATCTHHSLPYFNDPTNFIPSHTPRNQLRDDISFLQARHLLHPHSFGLGGGPIALLNRSLETFQARLPTTIPCKVNEPTWGAITLFPSHLPPSTHPSATRSLLRNIIAFVSPSQGGITAQGLELARQRLWEGIEGDQAFTPGGGITMTPVKVEGSSAWVVSRQRARRGGGNGRMEIGLGEWKEWDGRVWVRITREGGDATDESFVIERKGRWGAPVVSLAGEKKEVLVDFRKKGVVPPHETEDGSWEGQGRTIEWRCKPRSF